MDLFVINRYTDDEPYDKIKPNEEDLRIKFLNKINQRKRNSEKFCDTHSEYSNKNEYKLLEKSDRNDADCSEKDILESDIPKKKKIKLKKKHSLELNNDKDETIDSEIEKQKKISAKYQSNEEELDEVPERELDEKELCKRHTEKNDADQTAFTILKDPQLYKKNKIKRKLPDWLANPSVVSVDLKNLTQTIDSIPELDSVFIEKLKENGITHFFPVQQQVIPCLLKSVNKPDIYWPNDICVSAPTGSGKTLAFVLPILQTLYKRIVPKVRALVVLPVQDLANQVYQVFKTYSEPTKLEIILLSKLRSFEEEQQLLCMKDGLGKLKTLIDIIVTTPGRLVEHLVKTKDLALDHLQFLVIDEADKVMENMQNDWLYHLNKHLNAECTRAYQVPIITYNNLMTQKKPPHKLLFSATLSQDPEKLQQMGLFHPKLYTSVVKSDREINDSDNESKFVGKYTTPAELKEFYTICTKANKPLILHHLIHSKSWTNILCFVNSSAATTKLAFILKHLSGNKTKIQRLSANLTSRERKSILQKFYDENINVLISSDALARGIDFPNVRYVVSYDCPKFVKTYVHRIGRTGRAGKEGTSLTLLTSKEVNIFNKMVTNAGKSSVNELKFKEKHLEKYKSNYEEALESLAEYLDKKRALSLKDIKKKRKLQVLTEKKNVLFKNKIQSRKTLSFNSRKKTIAKEKKSVKNGF